MWGVEDTHVKKKHINKMQKITQSGKKSKIIQTQMYHFTNKCKKDRYLCCVTTYTKINLLPSKHTNFKIKCNNFLLLNENIIKLLFLITKI